MSTAALRHELQIERISLMKRRVAKAWAFRKCSAHKDKQIDARDEKQLDSFERFLDSKSDAQIRQLREFFESLNSLPDAIEGEPTPSFKLNH